MGPNREVSRIPFLKDVGLKMAKWGEGDPRWIVEDRPDATNVNNWHWYEKMVGINYHLFLSSFRTEKDASGWSRDKLEGLLVGLKFDGNEGNCVCVCVCIS